MITKTQAQRLKEDPALEQLLKGWRQAIIDDMLVEPNAAKRELLWQEQSFLERLSERIEVELTSIISGRESES